jgi:hypothetical protein
MLYSVSRYRSALVVVLMACVIFYANIAAPQPIYFEGFDDDVLAENTMVVNGTIANGFLSMNDPADARASFSVVQPITAEVMTFSFDMVDPIVESPPRMEVILRAGAGTAHNTLQNADQVVEAILFRAAMNRGAYTNNGNETIFLVANNKATDLTFPSPIDGTTVTLTGFQYIPYVLNHDTNMFGQVKGISAFNMPRPFERFGIGSSTTGDVGTFAIDNVLVMPGATFERDIMVGPTCILGDVDCNNIIELADFAPIRDNFRKMVETRAEGDLVRNGIVDFDDFRQWKAAFLGAGGSLAGVDLGFLAAVPEPGTAALLLMGLAVLANNVRTQRVRSVSHQAKGVHQSWAQDRVANATMRGWQ